MNKEELVQEISKKSKVTQKEANEVLSALIETVQKTVFNLNTKEKNSCWQKKITMLKAIQKFQD